MMRRPKNCHHPRVLRHPRTRCGRIMRRRLEVAESILKAIIEGAEVLANIKDGQRTALLVTVSPGLFNRLCEFGAELEDHEDAGDDEPSWGNALDGEGEPSLGSSDAEMDQVYWLSNAAFDREGPEADHEPSLGSCDGIVDQSRWLDGCEHGDLESERLHGGDPVDSCDAEENGDREPSEDREPTLTASWGHNMEADGLTDERALLDHAWPRFGGAFFFLQRQGPEHRAPALARVS